MNTLINRLKRSPEGSRKLSNDFLIARGWTRDGQYWTDPMRPLIRHFGTGPNVTSSASSALRMLPEGWFVQTIRHEHSAILMRGDIHTPLRWEVELQHLLGGRLRTGWAKTLPTAFCIAVLRTGETLFKKEDN